MPRKTSPSEEAILRAWAASKRPEDLRYARRSWCVLDRGLSSKDLSSSGLSEERVLAIRDAYDQMGLVGLVDSPRLGRPAKYPAMDVKAEIMGAGTDTGTAHIAKNHVRWRVARRNGLSLERHRMEKAVVRSGGIRIPAIQGVLLGAQLSVLAVCPVRSPLLQLGTWYHPSAKARLEALRGSASGRPFRLAVDLVDAHRAHQRFPGKSAVRGEREKVEFWCAAVADDTRRFGMQLYVAADSPSDDFLQLLKCLRREGLWEGPGGRLQQMSFVDEGTWRQMLQATVGEDLPNGLSSGSPAFAWACSKLGSEIVA